ncbi:MAG: PHP domain-containing protein [Clostridiales Family XIII bacterium]|jgi:predicted metal-dependent phosphoesterase TrpH|nr:PHP domain-containing protein [Clostridiales Family XIII bacterium]
MGLVDLHLHTSVSDGEYAPATLMRLALAAGAGLVAVTDHDSTGGVAEGRAAALEAGLDFVPGIEISTDAENEQHILGYLIDIEDAGLRRACDGFLSMREERIARVLAYLAARGVCPDRAEIGARGAYVGRPHIAAALVRAGCAASVEDAFRRYLTGEEFEKVNRPKPTARESIDAIRSAGGVAALAHPHSLRLEGEAFEAAIVGLRKLGLGALECHYGTYGPERRDAYVRMAERYGLVITGGSDFHGPRVKPGIEIATGRGGLLDFNDLGVVESLRIAARSRRG